VSFAAIALCVASQRVFIVVSIYSVIDSVRILLDAPSYDKPHSLSKRIFKQKWKRMLHMSICVSAVSNNSAVLEGFS
jgi:hypothetical protein